MDAFKLLEKQSGVQLEHPILSQLYDKLIDSGDFDAVEKLIELSSEQNLFNDYIQQCKYVPHWTRIFPSPGDPSISLFFPSFSSFLSFFLLSFPPSFLFLFAFCLHSLSPLSFLSLFIHFYNLHCSILFPQLYGSSPYTLPFPS